jgi:ligand-binding sensor domain-containing protein/signal transduction histidine kinase
MWKHPRRLAPRAAALWLWLGCSALAAGTGPRFHVDTWGTREGLAGNEVVTMIQTRDGYLWLGTLNGLVRFDGVQFKVFDEHNTPGLASGRIVCLFEDSRTNLWIGTETAGALLLANGRITPLGFGQGTREGRLRSACEDATGAVWLRTENGELRRYAEGKLGPVWTTLGPGHALMAEKSGQVWVGTERGILAVDPAAARPSLPLPATQIASTIRVDFLLAARTGGGWCLGRDGVDNMIEKRLPGDRLERNLGRYPWPGGQGAVTTACEDRDGHLVIGTQGHGVWWFDGEDKAAQISTNEGLSSDYVLSLLMDNAGSLWVGLDSGGLNRVQRQLFHPLEAQAPFTTNGTVMTTETLFHPPEAQVRLTVRSVCQDEHGRLWFSSFQDGIDYWQDETLKHTTSIYENLSEMKSFDPRALLVDREQNIWAASISGGLFRWREPEGRFYPAPGTGDINPKGSVLHQDRQGRLWAGTQHGLACWDGHAWRLFKTSDGLTAEIVNAIADDAGGNLWIGTEGGGLNCLKEGKFTAPFRRAQGFPSDNISALYADGDNAVWVGTSGNGLIRLQNGSWTNYTTDDGLNGNGVNYIIEDDQGFLWIGSNAGLMRVKKSALNDFAAGKLDHIPCHTYGESDGLPSSECTPGSQPAACRARDGLFWFPTIKGLVSVDPDQIQARTNPLPLVVESVLVDGQEQNTNGPHGQLFQALVIPPGKESLDIQYTGLDLDDPQQARFRYLLEGHETRWNPAGKRRLAHYSKLPPGTYQFKVAARNEGGAWNPPGATLEVTVLPAFWQTNWFRAALAASLLGGTVAVVYLISTQKLQRQLEGLRQQQALEKDRARIARDIHDQVGASLTQLSLLGEMVGSDKENPAEVAEHAGQITQTARETAHALDEIVWTVNPSNDTLEGLINYICKHAQEYLAVAGLRYRLEAPAQLPDTEISPEARHNIFLAAKESVTNIVKHARATEACIRLRLGPGSFTLEIEDNGRGPGEVSGPAAQSRNGLRNMRKRMEDIGGSFEIVPGANGGTLVRLNAPMN